MVPVERVIQATGAPAQSVRTHWPTIYAALQERGIASWRSQIGAVATVTVECPPWEPIPEYATGEAYEGREDLGNTEPGDGRRYKGRGFIQLTGRTNYRQYGKVLRLDLEGNPKLALLPSVAADIFAEYWLAKKVYAACDKPDWRRVRKLVNGGYNGWKPFAAIIDKLDVRDE